MVKYTTNPVLAFC